GGLRAEQSRTDCFARTCAFARIGHQAPRAKGGEPCGIAFAGHELIAETRRAIHDDRRAIDMRERIVIRLFGIAGKGNGIEDFEHQIVACTTALRRSARENSSSMKSESIHHSSTSARIFPISGPCGTPAAITLPPSSGNFGRCHASAIASSARHCTKFVSFGSSAHFSDTRSLNRAVPSL